MEWNGFADDCVTMISGKNLKAMMNNLQKVVNKLETWGRNAGLKFNSSKTEVVFGLFVLKEAPLGASVTPLRAKGGVLLMRSQFPTPRAR